MMLNFPDVLMKGYSMPAMSGSAAAWTSVMFSVMAVQMGMSAFMNLALARDGVSDSAKGAACLSAMFGFGMFIVTDAYNIWIGKSWPAVIPLEGAYFNFAVWTVMIIISYMGYKSAGGEMPASFVLPFGRPKWGLIASIVNTVPYAVMATFMAPTFVDMYSPGVVAGFPPVVKSLIYMLSTGMGRMMINNIIGTLLVCEAGTETDVHRVQRAWVYGQMVFLGVQGVIGTVFDSNGWENPMKIVGFASNFAVIFFNTKTFGDTPFKLEAAKKPKKK